MVQQSERRIDDPVVLPEEKLLNRCYIKDSSIVSRKMADEFILVPIRQKAGDLDNIYTLNEVAARIWELLDGEKRIDEIRNAIVEEFEVEPEEAENDLMEFLQKLQSVGIIRET